MELREEQQAAAAMAFAEELRWRKKEKAILLSSMGGFGLAKEILMKLHGRRWPVQPGSVASVRPV